ncbi:hypothetical protein ACWEIM_18180 [Streptomyces sp. NPDC004778]
MHDDRTLVEGRLERALQQFVRPAQYAARRPLTVSVWHAPGEPVPVAEALGADFAPFTAGTERAARTRTPTWASTASATRSPPARR